MINGHVAFKLVYVRIFAGTDRMHKRDWVSVGSWIAIGLVLWIIAWIIAEAIPVFDNLLSLIVALFASWFTYGLSGVFWLYMNWGLYFSSWRKMVLTVVNVLIFGVGAALVSSLTLKTRVLSCTNELSSVASASTSPGKPSTITPAAKVSRAPPNIKRSLARSASCVFFFFYILCLAFNLRFIWRLGVLQPVSSLGFSLF